MLNENDKIIDNKTRKLSNLNKISRKNEILLRGVILWKELN